MSNITPTKGNPPGGNLAFTWAPMANGDVGLTADHTGSGDRTVQVTGTFGSGGTVLLEGSCDGTNWVTLRDAFNQALSFTAADVRSVIENTPYTRARVSAGDGTTSLTVVLNVRR